jgi:hypothetical protein
MSNSLKQLHWLSLRPFDGFPVQNEPTTVSPGLSAWHAMLAEKMLQMSRSGFLGYQTPLPLRWVSASPEDSSISLALLYPSLASLRLCEPHLTVSGQREQNVFKLHDSPSSPPPHLVAHRVGKTNSS